MSASTRHFILFRDIPLMYGRVPKVANSSIKASLCKLLSEKPDGGLKTTADRFWRQNTHDETKLITAAQARRLRETHFSFSFVRNPFDRLVAAYNNKIMEIDDVPSPMQKMGLYHAMPFKEFIKLVCEADPTEMDNHIRPQAEILITDKKLVPKFVGRMEHIDDHWKRLRNRMKLEDLPTLGYLPKKNVRRDERKDIVNYFKTSTLIDQVLERYAIDFKRFYGDYSIDKLILGEQLEKQPPLQRGVGKAKRRLNANTSIEPDEL